MVVWYQQWRNRSKIKIYIALHTKVILLLTKPVSCLTKNKNKNKNKQTNKQTNKTKKQNKNKKPVLPWGFFLNKIMDLKYIIIYIKPI